MGEREQDREQDDLPNDCFRQILPVPQISFFKAIIDSQKPGARAKLRSVR
jgi:hypothetical protein